MDWLRLRTVAWHMNHTHRLQKLGHIPVRLPPHRPQKIVRFRAADGWSIIVLRHLMRPDDAPKYRAVVVQTLGDDASAYQLSHAMADLAWGCSEGAGDCLCRDLAIVSLHDLQDQIGVNSAIIISDREPVAPINLSLRALAGDGTAPLGILQNLMHLFCVHAGE